MHSSSYGSCATCSPIGSSSRRQVVYQFRLCNLCAISDVTLAVIPLTLTGIGHKDAHHVSTHFGNCYGIIAIAVATPCETKVIIAVNYVTCEAQEVYTQNLQAVATASVVKRDGAVACLAEHQVAA